MSYPDVVKAGDLRQGDHIHTEHGTTRRIMATHWRPGYSFIRLCIEGENIARSMPIGRAVYVRRES